MAFVYLDDFEQFCSRHPLWSADHAAPVWLRRADFLGDPNVPLTQSIADLVERRSGTRPTGRMALLTMPRVWGWSFNPITCYFCFDDTGERVVSTVLEVTNTPWHERHCYVVGGPGEYQFSKQLHVSPFLGMDLTYRVRLSDPGAIFDMHFDVDGPEGTQLFAGVRMERVPADRQSMGAVIWHPSRGSVGVTAGIYRQALALWRKGATFHRNVRSGSEAPMDTDV